MSCDTFNHLLQVWIFNFIFGISQFFLFYCARVCDGVDRKKRYQDFSNDINTALRLELKNGWLEDIEVSLSIFFYFNRIIDQSIMINKVDDTIIGLLVIFFLWEKIDWCRWIRKICLKKIKINNNNDPDNQKIFLTSN